jgi:uncharacterized membrane protein
MIGFLIDSAILIGLLALNVFMCGLVVFIIIFIVKAISDCLEGKG